LSESSDCIQQLNSNALNYAKENESLVASLQAVQIVAENCDW
jgi:hypothetical protein